MQVPEAVRKQSGTVTEEEVVRIGAEWGYIGMKGEGCRRGIRAKLY